MDVAGYQLRMNTNTRWLMGVICLLPTIFIFGAFITTTPGSFDAARQQILLRNIGHQVLLHSGDSTSRVLPVRKIAENEYQIRFENEFTFQPDSLVAIIKRSLTKDEFSSNYVVNVLNCTGSDVVFGFAIAPNATDNVVPCSGRRQPKSCYLINLKFKNTGVSVATKDFWMGSLPLLAFIGFIVTGAVKTGKTNIHNGNHSIKIGNTLYDPAKRQITYGAIVTELTSKENNLLRIFANAPNSIIERSRLQKEIWEDEGVIVGRSLDMFISKLRKKLENDASVELKNIHGKGYKLEC